MDRRKDCRLDLVTHAILRAFVERMPELIRRPAATVRAERAEPPGAPV